MAITFEKVLILKNIPMFENASEMALSDLISSSEEKTYKTGEILIDTEDENAHLFIIVSGCVRCVDKQGNETEFGPRQFLGETTVLSPAVLPYQARATEKTTVLKISGRKLYQVMSLHPSIARGFIGELSRRLRQFV